MAIKFIGDKVFDVRGWFGHLTIEDLFDDELTQTSTGGVVYEDAGGAISGLAGAGADIIEYADAGLALSGFIASGLDAVEFSDAGISISGLAGAGDDTVEYVDLSTA